MFRGFGPSCFISDYLEKECVFEMSSASICLFYNEE